MDGVMDQRVLPGQPYPLGATWDGSGTNFAVFSESGTAVELCLFHPDTPEVQYARVLLPELTAHIFHGYLPDVGPGTLYGFRAHGPWAPDQGQQFNPAKLLIDPYARALIGEVQWDQPVHAYILGDDPEGEMVRDDNDSAAGMPRSVVIDTDFDWGNDRLLRIPWNRSVIYEVHVRGFTVQHPGIPEELRGTYAGLAHPISIDYLKALGVTAVELLPVHAYLNDERLVELGLRNYWGYNTTNFFAPEARYASAGDRGGQVREFKEMVQALHTAGIEVILDVVYNHTSEGNHLGPMLSFKGLDNPAYYRLSPDDPRYYVDYTGTGNSLNVRHPQSLQLIMDSLRYWVEEMHVDGFRFDLAAALARDLHEVDRLSAFFDIIHQDPVISRVKLIAEPWDVGEGGYQVGNFPVLWTEWNAEYRDTLRSFWKGDARQMADFAYRFTGSSDLYRNDGRAPSASINFVTAHDGFTLHDLVSYNDKHNDTNGEDNRDGHNNNISWNHGVEGPTDDEEILALREQQKRNILATLFLSQGVPMLCGGDELGRTQQGNNNAYCQDNEISWYDWSLDERDEQLLAFVKKMLALRATHPVLRRRRFFQGRAIHGSDVRDITWFQPNGDEMTEEQWSTSWSRSIGVCLGGGAIDEMDENGERIVDDTLLILLSAWHEPVEFQLAANGVPYRWERMLDTAIDPLGTEAVSIPAGDTYHLPGRSVAVFRRVNGE